MEMAIWSTWWILTQICLWVSLSSVITTLSSRTHRWKTNLSQGKTWWTRWEAWWLKPTRDHHQDHLTKIRFWRSKRLKRIVSTANFNRIIKKSKPTRLKMKVVNQWWMLLTLVILRLQSTTIHSTIVARQVSPTRLPSRQQLLTQMMRWKIHVLIRTPIWQSAVNLHQVLRTLQLSGNPWEPFTLNNPVLIPNRCSSSTVVQIRPQLQQEKTNPTLVGMPWITKSIYLRQSLTRSSIKPMLIVTSKCQNLIS